ncbi:hypothetical protein [Sphingomonas oryzagri]
MTPQGSRQSRRSPRHASRDGRVTRIAEERIYSIDPKERALELLEDALALFASLEDRVGECAVQQAIDEIMDSPVLQDAEGEISDNVCDLPQPTGRAYFLHRQIGLHVNQIARRLGLDVKDHRTTFRRVAPCPDADLTDRAGYPPPSRVIRAHVLAVIARTPRDPMGAWRRCGACGPLVPERGIGQDANVFTGELPA